MLIGTLAVALVMTAAAAGAAGIPAAEHAGNVAAGPVNPAWWQSLMSSSPVWDCWPGHVCNDPVSDPDTRIHTKTPVMGEVNHKEDWTGIQFGMCFFFQHWV